MILSEFIMLFLIIFLFVIITCMNMNERIDRRVIYFINILIGSSLFALINKSEDSLWLQGFNQVQNYKGPAIATVLFFLMSLCAARVIKNKDGKVLLTGAMYLVLGFSIIGINNLFHYTWLINCFLLVGLVSTSLSHRGSTDMIYIRFFKIALITMAFLILSLSTTGTELKDISIINEQLYTIALSLFLSAILLLLLTPKYIFKHEKNEKNLAEIIVEIILERVISVPVSLYIARTLIINASPEIQTKILDLLTVLIICLTGYIYNRARNSKSFSDMISNICLLNTVVLIVFLFDYEEIIGFEVIFYFNLICTAPYLLIFFDRWDMENPILSRFFKKYLPVGMSIGLPFSLLFSIRYQVFTLFYNGSPYFFLLYIILFSLTIWVVIQKLTLIGDKEAMNKTASLEINEKITLSVLITISIIFNFFW